MLPHMLSLGVQILADLYGCDATLLNDPEVIERVLMKAAVLCGATIVNRCFHRFSPHGVSGVVVIAESHLAIHTWPEHRYAALDLFTCGETLRTDDCFRYLLEVLGAERHTLQKIPRGTIPIAATHSPSPEPLP